ncbi:MAG: aminotransferase class V-fold PLP-dependent enzyme [Saprospiraceae bacterium]
MLNRRKFIRRSALSAIPLLGFSTPQKRTPGFEDIRHLNGDAYWKGVRQMFPMPTEEAYFNTGTMGAQPTVVLEKTIESMRNNATNIAKTDYQGNGPLLLQGYEAYVDLRKKIGALINADYKEIALTQNATYGMNYVSNGLDLKPGDEIINTDQEHGGGRAGWQVAAARYKLVYKQAKIAIPANDPQQIIDSIKKEITPKTRIIAIPHIVSVHGFILPVKAICEMARERGIFTIIDGAQSVGQIPVDVKDLGCDAYFSSLHKWLLAPAGNGILYLRKEVMPQVWTTLASYQWENEEDHGFRLTQRGTGNPSIIVGLEAAIDFHNAIGPKKVTDRIKELGDYLRAGLQKIEKVTIESSTHPDMCAGITTYGIEGVKGVDLQNEMWKRKRMQPRAVGERMIRHSLHIYNLEHEIDAALAVVRDLAG